MLVYWTAVCAVYSTQTSNANNRLFPTGGNFLVDYLTSIRNGSKCVCQYIKIVWTSIHLNNGSDFSVYQSPEELFSTAKSHVLFGHICIVNRLNLASF